jgi:hypothetical protein
MIKRREAWVAPFFRDANIGPDYLSGAGCSEYLVGPSRRAERRIGKIDRNHGANALFAANLDNHSTGNR